MPACSCINHPEFSESQEPKVYKITSKKYQVAVVSELRNRGLLPARANYLCTDCSEYCKNVFLNDENTILVNNVIKAIKENKLDVEALSRISAAIGQSQCNAVSRDAQDIKSDFRNDEILQALSQKGWLEQRNKVLVAFLSSLSNIDLDNANKKLIGRLTSVIESIYALRTEAIVLPFSFCRNLITYFLTGSKNVCAINSTLGPCGSYSTILNWIDSHTGSPIQVDDSVDVVTYFDNNQVIGRNWRVRHDAKAVVSVITTIVHFLFSSKSTLQFQENLSPQKWLYSQTNDSVIPKILALIDQSDVLFRNFRKFFINERINVVTQEQNMQDGEASDHIDVFLRNKKRSKQYTGQSENESCRKLDDPYKFVEHGHYDHPQVVMGDPIAENPCSFEAVKIVLKKLSSTLTSPDDGSRKWSIIGCDGLPYHLAAKIIQEDRTLQNILLQPGLGHYEINMTKVFLKLTWDVVGLDLAKMLGFRSPKALNSCMQGNDHHKAWQMFELFLYGIGDELLLPYIRQCMDNNETPNADGFFDWAHDAKNPNYRFLLEAIFTYAIALFFYRVGVRRNNHEIMLAARIKFSPLFYGFNKINYQQIDFTDLKTRVCAPPAIKQFIENHESVSVSGNPSKGEGYDFILESKNKATKMWMPPGSPTQSQWLRVCRNIDRLEKIQNNFITSIGIQKESGSDDVFHTNLSKEIKHWRVILRESEYLASPKTDRIHESLSGEVLDSECVNFSAKCKDNRMLFFGEIQKSGDIKSVKNLEPVFILVKDRDHYKKLENKTKQELAKMIKINIDEILEHDSELAATFQTKWEKQIKFANKNVYITFYKEVFVALESLTNYTENCDEDLHLEDAEN